MGFGFLVGPIAVRLLVFFENLVHLLRVWISWCHCEVSHSACCVMSSHLCLVFFWNLIGVWNCLLRVRVCNYWRSFEVCLEIALVCLCLPVRSWRHSM